MCVTSLHDPMVVGMEALEEIRKNSGPPWTTGLKDEAIADFLESDPSLSRAIEEAHANFQSLSNDMGSEYMLMDERKLVSHLQSDYVNFYSAPTVNPYVAIAARGPWIVTSHGAVLHDNGGYGMLGMGHGPEEVINSMQQNWVMANVMTPSFSQKRLADRLRKEVGHTRGKCPFSRFVCLNSGSESVTISMRIADANTLLMTQKGGKHEGNFSSKELKMENCLLTYKDLPLVIPTNGTDIFSNELEIHFVDETRASLEMSES